MPNSPRHFCPVVVRHIPLAATLLGVGLLAWACESRPRVSVDKAGERVCASCHMVDYRSARNHENVKPTRCEVCHRETTFLHAKVEHEWPLTGAHGKADCFACHVGKPAVFEGTGTACVACHRDDFDKSNFPGHGAFPQTCGTCHGTDAWKPAKRPAPEVPSEVPVEHRAAPSHSVVHTTKKHAPAAAVTPEHPENRFPIAHGSHSDIGCETCHDGGGRMGKGNTDCVQCHKRARFDRKHTNVARYPLGDAPANFCVECHTRGSVQPVAR